MKLKSATKPEKLTAKKENNKVIFTFNNNIIENAIISDEVEEMELSEIEAEEISYEYEYDSVSLKLDVLTTYKDLITKVKNNYDTYYKLACDVEYDKLAAAIREKRNQLLNETDKEFSIDRFINNNMTSDEVFNGIIDKLNSPMAQYRQKLRDIPNQENFPYKVNFPNKPIN